MFRPVIRSVASKRLFSMTPARNNIVSELYIQQIKAFKPIAISAKELESAVKAFQLPAKATIPSSELPTEALSEYESSEVETETVSASGSSIAAEEDWFVFEEEHEEHH
ncbi:F1F0-ATPase complex, subunit H [Scheffersomyces coipomensis]|uniref:F1F0-ATPase complex, subunit H n=1 Tax=Scheffersomyces coipomensis TaxID=1788519 RepID=UPI00315DC68F